MAMGLGRSLRVIGESVPTAILTDIDADWSRYFDIVLRPPAPWSRTDKLLALELTCAEQVVYLDCDSLAFRPLGPVFDYCAGKAFAVQGDTQNCGNWHGADVAGVCKKLGRCSIPRFNSGLVYYERQPSTLRLFEAIRTEEKNYGANEFEQFRGKPSDEVCILLGMLRTGIGEVIPDETDFMSTGVGMIGRLDMDIRQARCEFLCRREHVRHIRPHVFHASRYSNFLVYWRQLARLQSMRP